MTALAACTEIEPLPSTTRTAGAVETVSLEIEGMHCEGCVNAIAGTVDALDGVRSCDVSLEDEFAVVTYTDPMTESDVVDAVASLGYTVTVATSDDGASSSERPAPSDADSDADASS